MKANNFFCSNMTLNFINTCKALKLWFTEYLNCFHNSKSDDLTVYISPYKRNNFSCLHVCLMINIWFEMYKSTFCTVSLEIIKGTRWQSAMSVTQITHKWPHVIPCIRSTRIFSSMNLISNSRLAILRTLLFSVLCVKS